MKWLEEHWFKVGILSILLLVVILSAYYFMIFVPQREAAREAAAKFQSNFEKFQKESCVTQAEQIAINEYESSPLCTGSYAPSTCTDGSTYLVAQYSNAYNVCLQSKGLNQ